MEQNCRRCFSLFREGERVCFIGEASFHVLKSAVHYALDKADMTVDSESLVHADGGCCRYETD